MCVFEVVICVYAFDEFFGVSLECCCVFVV